MTMSTGRRQQRLAKLIKQIVSEAILTKLSDPRINAVVSVTEVKLTPDNRKADVFLSMLALEESDKRKTLSAIKHARGHIQTMLAHELNIRFCPIIEFFEDEKIAKTNETLKLIDQVAAEFKEKPLVKDEEADEE